ncbi:hypothetical protein ABT071_09405 [Streptomyces sp. NPDC002506]|uniref:hypothetical protein n=1 Tax=unclassified Streptomyces TaxID=2593676 RepID=UPI001F1703D7|nr:hypothetical protein [Streptomyces sp. CB01201]
MCWISLRAQPWQRTVPSLLARTPKDRGDAWTVFHGVARHDWRPRTLKAKAKWTHIECSLGDVIGWILDGGVHPRTSANGTVWWTALAYDRLALGRARLEAEAEAIAREEAASKRSSLDQPGTVHHRAGGTPTHQTRPEDP